MIDILLIEDSPEDSYLFERFLKKGMGNLEIPFLLRKTNNYAEGEAAFKEKIPDCVVLDYQLPGENGLETLKRLQDISKGVGFIMLTGQGDEKTAVKAMKMGASDYLVKNNITSIQLGNAVFNAISKKNYVREIEDQKRLLEAKNKALLEQKKELETALLTIESDNHRKTKELDEARNIQLSMLPEKAPLLSGWDIDFKMQPASEVGGDYFDYYLDDQGEAVLAIGDATDHGFKSGIIVAMVKSYFQTLVGHLPLETVMKRISNGIKGLGLRGMYMGLTLVKIRQNIVKITSAGMPPIFYYDSNKLEWDQIRIPGMFLGAPISTPIKSKEIELDSDDHLLFISDGLIELFSPEGEMLGLERIQDHLNQQKSVDSQDLVQSLNQLAENWTKEKGIDDDMTIAAIRPRIPENELDSMDSNPLETILVNLKAAKETKGS